MKGIELPVNVLVIIAVAVIVLLGVIALYMSGFIGSTPALNMNVAWNQGCASVVRNCAGTAIGTDIAVNYDVNGDGKIVLANDNFLTLCQKIYGSTTSIGTCKQKCGCP